MNAHQLPRTSCHAARTWQDRSERGLLDAKGHVTNFHVWVCVCVCVCSGVRLYNLYAITTVLQ